MTTKKKIIFTILLAVLVGVLIYSIVYDILLIKSNLNDIKQYAWVNGQNDGYYKYKDFIWKNYITPYIVFLIPLIVSFVYFVIKIISIWTNKIFLFIANANYSYQDYKEQKEQKKQLKIERRKKELLDKISKM